jgi:hypothetical protein
MNTGEQHTMTSHKLQSAVMLTGIFENVLSRVDMKKTGSSLDDWIYWHLS